METKVFERAPGRTIEYEESSTGDSSRTLICLPGIGDLRSQYRQLLAEVGQAGKGYKMITMDLRGLGGSSDQWDDFSGRAVGEDVVEFLRARVDLLGVYVLGNSMAAAAAVWAAAELPTRVRGIVLLGPFVRDLPLPPGTRPLLWALLQWPWGAGSWSMFYKTLYVSSPPDDLAQHQAAIASNLRQGKRLGNLRRMLFASKSDCEKRIPEVKCKVLVVMGSKDPDFPNPEAETDWIKEHLSAEVQMLENVGHYPHVEAPSVTASRIFEFVDA